MTERLDPTAPFRLDGKVVILTGASSGLGRRFAQVLDGLGASVVLAARRTDRIDALAKTMTNAIAVTCDVGATGANEALVDATVAHFGRIDALCVNAGVANTVPASRETPEDFANLVNVDLVSPFVLARAALQHLRETQGNVVMIASAAGFGSTPFLPQAGYVAAKTGLVGLTRELALQWGRHNVRVNALCPGMFASEMTSALTENDALRSQFETQIPLRRIGREHELDGALAFLISDASSYMTGTTLVVDGGVNTL